MSLHIPMLDPESAAIRLRSYLEDGELRSFSDVETAVGPTVLAAIDILFESCELSIINAAGQSFYQRKLPHDQ